MESGWVRTIGSSSVMGLQSASANYYQKETGSETATGLMTAIDWKNLTVYQTAFQKGSQTATGLLSLTDYRTAKHLKTAYPKTLA